MIFESGLRTGAEFSTKPIRLVIFDVAGTIIEDHGEVLFCLTTALRKNNIQTAEEELHEWKGASKREVIKHFVEAQTASGRVPPEDLVNRIYNEFRHMLEERYQTAGVTPIPGRGNNFSMAASARYFHCLHNRFLPRDQ